MLGELNRNQYAQNVSIKPLLLLPLLLFLSHFVLSICLAPSKDKSKSVLGFCSSVCVCVCLWLTYYNFCLSVCLSISTLVCLVSRYDAWYEKLVMLFHVPNTWEEVGLLKVFKQKLAFKIEMIDILSLFFLNQEQNICILNSYFLNLHIIHDLSIHEMQFVTSCIW